MSYDGSLKFDTRMDESGFSSGINRLGNIAKTGLAVLGGVIAGAAVATTKAALDSVASLEQNVGGVETLFKKSADTVIKNAKNAYQTAGMSANEYMSTVTSFSASLLQSLGNDTKKAASYADRAIVDMSDNANKMSTNMELIQNAYQGFAKQNYTMLDNLKLGYGGTKEEMSRLIADASEMKEVQEKLGITVDESSMSFGNIVNAISVVQSQMGIAGTTAKEAATTIEGSMSSAKAAWDNFLSGAGSAEELADALTTAGIVVGKNLGEIIPRLAETIPEFATAIGEQLPKALEEMDASGMVEAGRKILNDLITGVQENAPVIISKGADILSDFISGIASNLPNLVPQALQMVVTIADAIISNIPTIVNAGLSLIKGLVEGIINSLPTLIAEGPRIINDFADAIYGALWTILKTGAQLIVELGKGLINNIPLVKENALAILKAIINVMSLSKLLSLGKSLISNLAKGIKGMGGNIANAGKEILTKLVSGIKALASNPIEAIKTILTNFKNEITKINWKDIGDDIVGGIAKGVTGGVGALLSAARNVATQALDAIKKKLGINSPSRRFRDEVGKMMAAGMGIGFEKNIPEKEMTQGLERTVGRMKQRAVAVTSRNLYSTNNIVKRVSNSYINTGIDYKKIKQAQLEAQNEANKQPIVLNKRNLRRDLREEGFVIA